MPYSAARSSLPAKSLFRFAKLGEAGDLEVDARQPHYRVGESAEDPLLDLAAQLEPDGGMPGKDLSSRVARSIATLLAFVDAGHTMSSGALRSHVTRLIKFLSSLTGLPAAEKILSEKAVAMANSGRAPHRDWLTPARSTSGNWKAVREALA